ncbi:MAG: hypothetical protein UX26_C0024G0009 [Parcubacteria group bacterium GW2011_GWC1_45_9]|nr:MAG: hypothetical protein UW89_C0003G0041 [Parcubacteria group bacterium GW2011_GWB1_45_10]KKU16451.1 MAG: hypothetical protein UX26_C0024G0009 [Parcubacteria group bacterium GW2011_GWC1_45_9]
MILIVAIVLIIGGLFALPRFFNKSSGGLASGVPCLVPNIPLVQHVHPHLQILVDGDEEIVPANVGLSGCERALHTHDTTGEIHVEAQDTREYTLGDFISVWGKDISWPGYTVTVKVDGKISENPIEIPLKDKEQIVMEYEKISQ